MKIQAQLALSIWVEIEVPEPPVTSEIENYAEWGSRVLDTLGTAANKVSGNSLPYVVHECNVADFSGYTIRHIHNPFPQT